MRKLLNSILFLTIFIMVTSANSAFSDAFKCVDVKGNIVFQDDVCGDDKKESRIKIEKINSNPCSARCDTQSTLCLAELGNGARNTPNNALLCMKVKTICYAGCEAPSAATSNAANSAMSGLVTIERSSYERNLRREQVQKNEARYNQERDALHKKWEEKRKQRHCHRYEKKLEKIKAKWKRKQRQGWKPQDETYFLEQIATAEDAVAIECR